MTTVVDEAVRQTTPQPAGRGIEALSGPRRTALRRPGQRTWIVVEGPRLATGSLPLGLQIELERSDAGRGDGFGSQRSLPPHAPALRTPPLRPPAALSASAVLAAVGLAGLATGAANFRMDFAGAVVDLDTLVLALLLAWAVLVALRLAEGALLACELRPTAPWMRLSRFVVRVEPVCWRLGVSPRVPLSLLSLPVAAFLCAAGWRQAAPGVAVGVATGALLYLTRALYPLRPGLGASLLQDLLRVRDLPARLRWTLVSRFVPVPSRLEVSGSWPMVVAALAFCAWAAATGGALYWISAPPLGGATAAGRLWQVLFALVLLTYTAWLAWQAAELFGASLTLRDRATVRSVDPGDALRAVWAERNPLARHVPALRSARWAWGAAPRGAVLIREGAEDRHFLWLADGSVSVLARAPAGDPILVAELRGGSGIGEVALLEGGRRTADVIAREESVVAILEKEEFDRMVDDEARALFRDLVHASQALARCPTLWGLAPDDRAAWLSAGVPGHHAEGDVLIRQGDTDRWVGLLVRGRLSVERDGTPRRDLGPDDLFGEMAYVLDPPRRATLRAETPVLIWRWEPAFLDRSLAPGELRDAFARLAAEREP